MDNTLHHPLFVTLTLYYPPVLSADNLCKQFVPRSGLTICQACSESKQFATLMLFQKEFFEKFNLKKKISRRHVLKKIPACKVNHLHSVKVPNKGVFFNQKVSHLYG